MSQNNFSKKSSVGCVECMKYILILLNMFFVILGCVLLFLGVWFYAVPANKSIAGVTLTDNEKSQLHSVSLIVIGVGSAIVLFSIVACYGVVGSNKCLLIFTFLLTLLLLVLQFVICAFGFIFQQEIFRNIENEMAKSLATEYKGDNATDLSSIGWNEIQQRFQCCGVSYQGYLNYTEVTYYSDAGNKSTNVTGPTEWYTRGLIDQDWPHSCCMENSSKTIDDQNVQCINKVNNLPTYRNNIGCLDETYAFLKQHFVLLASLAAILAIVELTYLLLTWRVYRSAGVKRSILL